MFDLFNPEENFDRKLANLEKENEKLDAEFQSFLDGYGLTEEKLHYYLSKKEHFSEETWKKLAEERKKMDVNLILELKKKATTQTKEVQRHWIYTR